MKANRGRSAVDARGAGGVWGGSGPFRATDPGAEAPGRSAPEAQGETGSAGSPDRPAVARRAPRSFKRCGRPQVPLVPAVMHATAAVAHMNRKAGVRWGLHVPGMAAQLPSVEACVRGVSIVVDGAQATHPPGCLRPLARPYRIVRRQREAALPREVVVGGDAQRGDGQHYHHSTTVPRAMAHGLWDRPERPPRSSGSGPTALR